MGSLELHQLLRAHDQLAEAFSDGLLITISSKFTVEAKRNQQVDAANGKSDGLYDIPSQPVDKENHISETYKMQGSDPYNSPLVKLEKSISICLYFFDSGLILSNSLQLIFVVAF